MSLPSKKEIQLPLLLEILIAGGEATPRDIYPKMRKYFKSITDSDIQATTRRGISLWENRIRFTREDLVEAEQLYRKPRNIWRLTPMGEARVKAAYPSLRFTKAAEIQEAYDFIESLSGKKFAKQGISIDAEMRFAIERYAMTCAMHYYVRQGWKVEDVSRSHSYDLRCTRRDKAELHVEVKGTTSDGSAVLLTLNEVRHARDQYPNIDLFIVANIEVKGDEAKPIVNGGTATVIQEWQLEDERLTPIGFEYEV